MNIKILTVCLLFTLFLCAGLNETRKTKHERKKNRLRKLDNYVPLNIKVDWTNFRSRFPEDILTEEGSQEKIEEAFTQAQTVLEQLLSISIDEGGSITRNETTIEEWGMDEWDSNIFNEFTYETNNYNYIIAFKFSNEIKNVASARIVEQFAVIPLVGIITINPTLIKSKISMPEYLKTLMLHQIIHLLGFHVPVFDEVNEIDIFSSIIEEGEEEETGDKYYYISELCCERVMEYARNYFNCPDMKDDFRIILDLDEDGNVHWPKRLFLGELMTEFDYPEEQVLSGFTLAFLEDTTNFIINYNYTGGLMRFGKHKGCDFVNPEINCGGNDLTANINSFTYANEFHLPLLLSGESPMEEPSCSSGRLSKTVHKFHYYEPDKRPSIYEYLQNGYGGVKSTNYCPISEYQEKNEINIYKGRCSEADTSVDDMAEMELGESFSPSSFCVLSSLLEYGSPLAVEFRSVCYEMFCSSRSLTIKVKDRYIVCPRSGGKIAAKDLVGYILCPDYNLICTGEKVCNNLFSCVENESTEKEDTLNYDYDIKTTQNSALYETNDNIVVIENYELSNDEKKTCPTFCKQCGLDKKCIECAPFYKKIDNDMKCVEIIQNCDSYTAEYDCFRCKDTYILAQDIKDNPNICIENDNNILKHYYQFSSDPDYYKRCDNDGIINCDECTTNTVCDSCKSPYEKIDDATICGDLSTQLYYQDTDGKYKSCSLREGKNCKKCEMLLGNFICKECQNGYAFFFGEINTNECISKSTKEMDKYYTNDGMSYFPCFGHISHMVENCQTCQNELECDGCIGDYISVNDKRLCILLSEKKYYQDTDNYYKLCSVSLEHCLKCESETTCIECDSTNNYLLEDTGQCFPKSQYDSHYYYKIGESDIYANCSKKITNCEKCNSAIDCTSCLEGSYFVKDSDGQITCQQVDINYYYEKNEDGKTYYIKCDKDMPHCDKCSSQNSCNQCSTNYGIIEDDRTKCEDLLTEKYYKETSTGKYRLCYHKLPHCEKCTLDESNFSCKQCEANYALKHDNNIECIEKSAIINDNSFFTNDSSINYYSCNLYSSVEHCLECSNKDTCSKCQLNYNLVNQSTACVLQNDIDNHLIYYDEALNIYVRCSDLISECNKCSNRTTCFECGNEAVLEEKDTCISKEFVENNSYFEDETTHKYISCSIIPNCVACTSSSVCKECQKDFVLKDNKCQLTSNQDGGSKSSSKLSTGAIIGIVLGCLGFLLLVAGGVYFLLNFRKNKKMTTTETNLAVNEEKVFNSDNEKQGVNQENIEEGKTKKRSIHNV